MNIALIDRHPMFRAGIRVMLKSQFQDVTTIETGSIQSLGRYSQRNDLDIILIGLSEEQPEIEISTLKKAMKYNPGVCFILCCAHEPADSFASLLMRNGVKGLLTKDCGPDDLALCVNTVLSGHCYVCSQVWAVA